MVTLYHPTTVSSCLLQEVAHTEWLLDPASLCLAALLAFVVLGLMLAYVVLGHSPPRARRPVRLHRLAAAH